MSAFMECLWAVRWWLLAALVICAAVAAIEEWREDKQ